MGKRKAEPPSLSPLENAVMRVVWDRGKARAEEVRVTLDKQHGLKDSTVRTLLRRLEAKGALEHTVDGLAYVYRPKMEREHMAAKAVRGIADRLCQGSIASLLLGMADDSMISADELRRLADRIDQAEQEQAKSAKRKQRIKATKSRPNRKRDS